METKTETKAVKEVEARPETRKTEKVYKPLTAAEEIARVKFARNRRIARRRRVVGEGAMRAEVVPRMLFTMRKVGEKKKKGAEEEKGEGKKKEVGLPARMFWGAVWVSGLCGLMAAGVNDI